MSSNPTVQPRRSRLLAAVLLLLTFGAGVAAGLVLDRVTLARQGRIIPKRGVQFMADRLVKRLDRAVDLSAEQEPQAREILTRRIGNIERVWRGARPQVQREADGAWEEIERILTAEQRHQFRKVRERWRRFSQPDL